MLEVKVNQRQRAYSLLELLITLAIVAILAAVTVPAFTDFIRNQRLRSVANDLTTVFQFARSESVTRNMDVMVARSGSAWSDGWTVIAGATTLRTTPAVDGVDITASATSFTFQSDGRVSASGTFSLGIPGDNSIGKCVRLLLSGSSLADDGAC